MGDLKLFRVENGCAVELQGTALALEKPLQVLIERNMEILFGVRLVASEHSTGKKHGGRIAGRPADAGSGSSYQGDSRVVSLLERQRRKTARISRRTTMTLSSRSRNLGRMKNCYC
jgi:hypothetical protein